MSDNEAYYKDLNILYLEKAIDIERVFIKSISYLSLAAIVVSLLFIKTFLSFHNYIDPLWMVFVSWSFFIASIISSAVMVLSSATFKDIMFEGTFAKINEGIDLKTLNFYRSHWTGMTVYCSAIVAATFFMLGLIVLLLYIGVNLLKI